MIPFQNLYIDSKTDIFLNTFRPKCIFWWMFEQIPTGLYCLLCGGVQLGER